MEGGQVNGATETRRGHPPVILVDGDDATLIAEAVSKAG